jgi:prepilin-type N-terminal cleavage/methylation domain-containing protein
MHTPPRRGFTIVEILVVLSIIVVLVGLLAYGIQTASRSARKTREVNNLRQVGLAWAQYSTNYKERLLPGWLDDGVQELWRTRYRNSRGETLDREHCRAYPWRLLPFLSYDFGVLYNYLEQEEPNWDGNPSIVAENPAFGINAYYVGGWWPTPTADGTDAPPVAKPVFANSVYTDSRGVAHTGRVVVQSQGTIRRPTELIVFAASAFREPGFYRDRISTYQPGAAWVVPPRLAETEIWTASYGDNFQAVAPAMLAATLNIGVEVFQAEAVPIARHNPSIATVRADLSTLPQSLTDLVKMDRWIDVGNESSAGVNTSGFTHSPE